MKALIAMSGGVDSSVAASEMVRMGYECIGCTMKLYDNEEAGISGEHTCCSLDDVEDARSVATRLGMPYYVFNFKEDFGEKVIAKFADYYRRGLTPNPCIDCNRYMKFDKLYERARVLGCDVIVTGHYARIEEQDGKYYLKKALDPGKDQSYVLYCMSQEQLRATRFPLGGMEKQETRRIAEENGFINANKPDSQDICFAPDGDYAGAIERFTGEKMGPGEFVDEAGNVIGTHKGIIHYTIGQRKGLGLPAKNPWYVCRICAEKNQVVLGSNEDLFGDLMTVGDLTWTLGEAPARESRCSAKIRYRHKEAAGTLTLLENGQAEFRFDEKQRAITPGQAAVFYDGDIVLGGGVIL